MDLVQKTIADQRDRTFLIIDGIRHVQVADALRNALAPCPLYLVYLDTPRTLIIERLMADGATRTSADRTLSDPTEVQIDGPLRRVGAVRLDGTQNVETLVREVISEMGMPTTSEPTSGQTKPSP
jgi:hypothetical protein